MQIHIYSKFLININNILINQTDDFMYKYYF